MVYTVLFVKELRAGHQGTMPRTTGSLASLPQPEFQLQRSPDDLTLVPWQSGKSMCWDVTVICLLVESYANGAAIEAGSAAEVAASHMSLSRLLWRLWALSTPLLVFL